MTKFFYIEILYSSLCSPDFTSLRLENLGKKFLAPAPWPNPGSATASVDEILGVLPICLQDNET